MFTGIIRGSRPVISIVDKPGLRRIVVDLGEPLGANVERGASIAINGVCLTATEMEAGKIAFDIIAETLNKTTLGGLSEGSMVHVERSAKFGDEVGGHVVSGHVTGMAEVTSVESPENNHVITMRAPEEAIDFIFSKGFVALDGASLTVVDVDREQRTFCVWLIPETLEITTFGDRVAGDFINLEVDPQTVAIVATVERVLAAKEKKA